MNANRLIAAGGLMALALACGPVALADQQPKPQANPQASPSVLPKSEATTQAVTGENKPAPKSEVGNQQASPSEEPASKATTEAVKSEPERPGSK